MYITTSNELRILKGLPPLPKNEVVVLDLPKQPTMQPVFLVHHMDYYRGQAEHELYLKMPKLILICRPEYKNNK